MTNEHTSLEKIYLSHFILERVAKWLRKGWCWWEVCWRLTESATYWPQAPVTIAALLSHSDGLLNRGPEGRSPLSGAGSHSAGILSPTASGTHCLELTICLLRTPTDPSVAPGYIIVCRPPASCGRTHLHRIQLRPLVKVIFQYLWPDAPVSAVPLLSYTGASLNWLLGRGSVI